jgi:hypothetical protein
MTGAADVGSAQARDQRGRLGQHAQGRQVSLRAPDQPDPRSSALRHRYASDETSVRVGKRTWWIWVFHHDEDCCFVIRASRGKDVVEEFPGDVRPDFWVSDRLAAQVGWANLDQQVCLAHRSVSGVLKNALDVGSRPYGQNVLDAKPGAIVRS